MRASKPQNATQPNTAPTIEQTDLDGGGRAGFVGRVGGGSVAGGA